MAFLCIFLYQRLFYCISFGICCLFWGHLRDALFFFFCVSLPNGALTNPQNPFRAETPPPPLVPTVLVLFFPGAPSRVSWPGSFWRVLPPPSSSNPRLSCSRQRLVQCSGDCLPAVLLFCPPKTPFPPTTQWGPKLWPITFCLPFLPLYVGLQLPSSFPLQVLCPTRVVEPEHGRA